mmetsp:Transcript_29059/g.89930  ORF Transcript_29059/g.89930 Transcript_29059/m.89930 type:complete len:175 (+) Transcript_29059:710-1234(+)
MAALRLSALLLLAARARAHPCDAEAMTACPFDGGAALGKCLQDPSKHEAATDISAGCQDFIALHTTCSAEFAGGTCGGSAFTDDALLCLTNWMNPADVSADCTAALPAKEEKIEVEVDEATLLKRAKRKRAREKAAEEVRKLNEKNSGKPAKKKPTKKRKKKPSSSGGQFGDDL